MTLEPLINSTFAIQVHTAAAILAFFLGGLVQFRRKGDRVHRIGGRLWVGLMLAVAITSFFIHTIHTFGIWSPIHGLSLATLWFLGHGVWLARRRRIMERLSAERAGAHADIAASCHDLVDALPPDGAGTYDEHRPVRSRLDEAGGQVTLLRKRMRAGHRDSDKKR